MMCESIKLSGTSCQLTESQAAAEGAPMLSLNVVMSLSKFTQDSFEFFWMAGMSLKLVKLIFNT